MQVSRSTAYKAGKHTIGITTKQQTAVLQARIDAATTRCVEMQGIRLLVGLVDAGIIVYSATTGWPVLAVGRGGCWCSFDEVDVSLIPALLRVVCNIGACPKTIEVNGPKVKISAVLGSKSNFESTAPVLIIQVVFASRLFWCGRDYGTRN